MSFLSENLTQFTVAQLAYPTLAAGYGHIGQMALVLNHLVDSLLEGVLGDEPMHQHVLMLADTVGAVGGLRFHCRVPPQVVVDDMAGCVCLEAGVLIDTFSPMREDFLK